MKKISNIHDTDMVLEAIFRNELKRLRAQIRVIR